MVFETSYRRKNNERTRVCFRRDKEDSPNIYGKGDIPVPVVPSLYIN